MVIGILGGGQLARMLALAGHPLGLEFVFLCPAPDACAAPLGEHIHSGFDDESALSRLATRADVITYEFENIPTQALRYLSERIPVYPPVAALNVAQNRLLEKRLFRELGIPTPSFSSVDSLEDLEAAVKETGFPCVLKTRTEGYDGKGQIVLQSPRDLESAWENLAGVPAIIETFVAFEREVSVIAVRGRDGATAFYPLTENTHRDGILHLSISRPNDLMHKTAEEYARRLLDKLEYVGVLALELFHSGDELLANEFAPRVHNSGHWTIEGAETSQFENHLRAILGWPLGDSASTGHTAMVNFIGHTPDPVHVLNEPHVHLHLYGKESRPGRKVGHATLHTQDAGGFKAGLSSLLALPESG